jgi:hypothetical protein
MIAPTGSLHRRRPEGHWVWRSRYVVALLVLLIVAFGWSLMHMRYVKAPKAAPTPRAEFSLNPKAAQSLPSVPAADGSDAHPPVNPQPDRLYIPSLGTDAAVVPEVPSTHDDGARQVTAIGVPAPAEVGLSTGGATLSATDGTVLIVGHINLDGVRGALWNLSSTHAGADIWVSDAQSHLTHWRAYANPVVDKNSPAWPASVFDATGPRRLVLASCTGTLHFEAGYGYSYDDNQFVYAEQLPTI